MASNSGGVGGIGGVGGGMSSLSGVKLDREYDIKEQLDQAMAELNNVRVQYIDSKRRCDNAQEKLDYYIQQYTTTMGQLEMAHQDIGILREKFTESSNEKIRLQQKVNHLEKKLSRIIESMKLENGNSQTICAFLEQYNELKKKYELNRGECEKMSKETEVAKKRCNDLMEDRNSLALEKDKLKHQLLMTTCQFNLVQRERDERLQSLKQNDDVIKELNHVLDTKIIELRRSTEQRNAAEQELSLILSEKDTVLKENQKLSDDLTLVMKKSNEMEMRLKEEKEALIYEQQRMKRDLEESLKFRDDVVKECESLREKLEDMSAVGSAGSGGSSKGESSSSNEHMTKSRSENGSWGKELSKEFNVEQHMRELEAANRENELLRKQLDKVHNEMAKATQDTELAKSRRDWAITEREKIVLERDSVKTLCDELRKERDTAISDLLAAIRDSESIKRQNDEAFKEIEQLKEHLETQQLSASQRQLAAATAGNSPSLLHPQVVTSSAAGGNNSRTMRWSCASAYDVDAFRKTDTEVVDIDISGLPTDGELGLILDGGRDENVMPGDDTGVYVVSIAKDSVCDGKLRPNDCIVKVNNLDCSNVSRRIVLESIRSSAPRCQVVVRRQLMNASHLYSTQLNLKCSRRAHGLSFESGMYIAKIDAGSLAARDKNLAVGDRIISINKRPVDGMTNPNDVLMQLDDNRNESAVIVGLKQIGQMNAAKLMHNNKMVNSCTQTAEGSMSGGGGGGNGGGGGGVAEKYYEEGNKRMVMQGTSGGSGGGSGGGSMMGNGNEGTSSGVVMSMSKSTGHGISSPTSGGSSSSAKSTSKLTELLKIIRGKTTKYSGDSQDDSQAQNEAISLLDSVLSNSEGGNSKSSVKRAKRKKESKDNGKSMGTWPRANIIAHENLSGTIVQKPKRERPTLSVFSSTQAQGNNGGGSGAGNGSSGDHQNDGEVNSGGGSSGIGKREIPPGGIYYDHVLQPVSSKSSSVQVPNPGFVPVMNPTPRKSVQMPVIQPPYLMNRHSVYSTLESHSAQMDPILMPKPSGPPLGTQTLSRAARHHNAMDYERQQLAAMNRMSLNFTPSDQSLFYAEQLQQSMKPKVSHHFANPQQPPMPSSSSSAAAAQQQQQQMQFMEMMKMSGYQQPSSSAYKLAPIDLPVKPPSRDSLDVYGATSSATKKYHHQPQQQQPRNVTRYPSDSEYLGPPDGGNTSTLPAYMRNHGSGSQIYGMTTNRGQGPKMLPTGLQGSPMQSPITTQPTDSTGMLASAASGSISEKSAFESYMSSSGASSYHHHAGNSMDYQYNKHRYQHQMQQPQLPKSLTKIVAEQKSLNKIVADQNSLEELATSHFGVTGYEGGTFPRKKENQRFRIPSNHSVTSRGSGVKNSTGSIEHHGSDRGSPNQLFHVEVLSHGSNINKRNTMTEYCLGQKPSPGDLRRVTIDKSVEPLGITIRCNNNGGGIFVATVAENSIASQVGLQTGDQLLEVCGLNMRSATYDLAASVLRQCGNTLNMLVQYNPDKYDVDMAHSTDDECVTPSGSSTPQNSPGDSMRVQLGRLGGTSGGGQSSASKSLGAMVTTKNASNVPQILHRSMFPPSSPPTVPTSPSILSASSPIQTKGLLMATNKSNNSVISSTTNSYIVAPPSSGPVSMGASSLVPANMSLLSDMNSLKSVSSTTPSATNIYQEEPRMLIIETKRKALGISFVGGNKTGIFVHRVVPDSLGDNAGIRVGDQILEFNGIDLRVATAEQAYLEIAKPTDKVSVVVQHNIQKFNQIDPDQESIDSLYVKVAFDRTGELGESELKFAKEDVLYVDNTMFTGTPGLWRAWTLDEYGHRIQCGLIPSQTKVEEELRLQQDTPDSDNTSRSRATASARRSFFRRKKHQRSSSDSKELASFSNTQLSYFSESGMLNDESAINSYIRMERLDYSNYRPILVIGPLAECVVDKLHLDFPSEFERCKLLPMNCPEDTLERNLNNNIYVDYRRRGSIFECTTVSSIKEVRDKKRHCCLDISITAIERLHRLQIYPIVLLLRFRSAKQIKEVKDSRYSTDKISAKAAKEMYEHSVKLESDYGHFISAIIPAGVNINHMSSQVKVAVEDEQKKVLWIPFASNASATSI